MSTSVGVGDTSTSVSTSYFTTRGPYYFIIYLNFGEFFSGYQREEGTCAKRLRLLSFYSSNSDFLGLDLKEVAQTLLKIQIPGLLDSLKFWISVGRPTM